MAFKQVKSTRASLFRPWAFGGDSQTLQPTTIDPANPMQLEQDKQSDVKSPPAKPSLIDTETNFLVPSAFRSTSSRTIPPLPHIDSPTYSIGALPLMNMVQDLHPHASQMQTGDEIMVPHDVKASPNTHPCWNIAQEIPFPVTPQFSQLLEQPNISKFRVKKQRPKRFRCPHCQVSFSNNAQLKAHQRIHSGERPFACDHPGCGKQFTRNEELTRHKRIHTGVRPHSCVLCGKRFGRKDHLKKHIKTHQRTNVVRMPMSAFQGLSYFVSDCIPWF